MKFLFIFVILLLKFTGCFGQDGGDMNYVKPQNLDKSHIGRQLHIDFNRNSFASYDDKRELDTVKIKVNGRNTDFIEHRVDDGYNNWFSRQFLESVEKTVDSKLKIEKFELLKFDDAKIFVKAFFIFVNKDGKGLTGKSFTKKLSFYRKDIVELLFKVKN